MDEFSGKKVRILGLGSPHGDDQLGWIVVQRCTSVPACECRLLKHPWDLVDALESGDVAVVVDAFQGGAPPGTIYQMGEADLEDVPARSMSSHGGSLAEAIRFARLLEPSLGEIQLLGIEIEQSEPAAKLSPAVKSAIPQLVARIREIVDRSEQTEPSDA